MPLPNGLLYKEDAGDQWSPVPQWAGFYEQLGETAARGAMEDRRLVVGLSVPSRYMAASFIAVGTVLAVASAELKGVTAKQRFRELQLLPEGTVLRFTRPGADKATFGTFRGTHEENGTKYIVIDGRDCRYYEPFRYAASIQQTDLSPEQVAGANRWRGSAGGSRRFLSAFLKYTNPATFESDAKPECLLLGPQGQLRDEILGQELAVGGKSGSKLGRGCLNDLLKVRKFGNAAAPSWSELASTTGARTLSDKLKFGPRVVVFDGARGFLRWRKYFPSSAWIVVLSRVEPQFTEAVHELNSEYAENSIDDPFCVADSLPDGVSAPPGLEMTSFFVGLGK